MKKILFITNKLIGGGSERVLTTIANSLSMLNYDVSILSYKNTDSSIINRNIKFYSLHDTKNKIIRIHEIRKVIKLVKPDTIISFEFFVNMQVIIAKFGLKNKLIVSERNDPSKKGNNLRIIRNFLYRFTDILVCQTTDAKQYFPQYIQKKATIIMNPLIDNLPLPYVGERKKKIVTFCRIEKQKNLPLLVDAFGIVIANHRDYNLIIYGDGTEKNSLINYVKEKKMEECIEFYGYDKMIHEKVLDAAMFVSSSDFEGMSNSMLESMAIGLPVICTDCPCGGARMVINNYENGILVPVGNVNELAYAMVEVIENKELAQKISSNATLIKDKLNNNRIVKMWEKLL